MHIYAFGSVCRGDVRVGSDVDLLALVDGYDPRFDPDTFSVYSYDRARELWREGNPFAWHLFLESTLVFASDDGDFLASLGSPGEYRNCVRDCEKFHDVFCEAYDSIRAGSHSNVFELSTLFLSIRNIARRAFRLERRTNRRFQETLLDGWARRVCRFLKAHTRSWSEPVFYRHVERAGESRKKKLPKQLRDCTL